MNMITLKKHSWQDITIADYKQILEITSRELDSETEKGISLLSVLCEVSEEEIYNQPISALNGLLEGIKWLNQPFNFNKNWKAKKITINGEKYNVVPDMNKFTVAQYADFQIYWDKRGDKDYMGKLLTIFIIPEGKRYNEGYDIVELADTLEQYVSITDFNSICFFFLMDCLRSIKASLYCSNWQITKMIWKEKDKEKKKELKQLRKAIIEKILEMKNI